MLKNPHSDIDNTTTLSDTLSVDPLKDSIAKSNKDRTTRRMNNRGSTPKVEQLEQIRENVWPGAWLIQQTPPR